MTTTVTVGNVGVLSGQVAGHDATLTLGQGDDRVAIAAGIAAASLLLSEGCLAPPSKAEAGTALQELSDLAGETAPEPGKVQSAWERLKRAVGDAIPDLIPMLVPIIAALVKLGQGG